MLSVVKCHKSHIIQPTGFKLCAHLRNGCGFSGQARNTQVWQGVQRWSPSNLGLISSKTCTQSQKLIFERPEWIQKVTNCVKMTQCWISLDCTILGPPKWSQPRGKGPRVYPCEFETCIFKTEVAPQKALFRAPRVDSKVDKMRQNDAKLNIARMYNFRLPLVIPN